MLGGLAALASVGGVGVARTALVEFGPNDGDYVRGFREDWERDDLTRFRWTSPAAAVRMPLRVAGPDFKLRLRLRRHLLESAHVRLLSEGRTLHAFEIAADPRVAYRTEEVLLPPLAGTLPFELLIQAPSENPRPLGVALDWLELERTGAGRFAPQSATTWRLVTMALVAYLLPLLCGGTRLLSLVHAGLLIAAGAIGSAWDPVAAERILREGAGVYVATACVALVLVRWPRSRAALGIDGGRVAAGLAVVVMGALAIRLVMLLHPQFYYPDIKVHALFARELARHGLVPFLRDFTQNQFRHSLGLQLENGHWYAFPYPPAFYVFCWPLVRFAEMRPEVAVSLLAGGVNSLGAILVFALGRRLGVPVPTAFAAAAAAPLLPLYTTRLSLAYFPALVGHAMDALAILAILALRRELARPRSVLVVALLVALALLTYTQSLVNFGLLLPTFLLLQSVFDRASWRRHLGLALAGALGALLSLALFYGRYVPVFVNMQRGVPMAGEEVLLEKLHRLEKQRVAADETPEQASDDPYAGPHLDLTRGVRKAIARMQIFYGPVFAPAVAIGFLLLIKRSEPELARFVLAWGSVYLLLNLGSAGLPGPNLLRYNKDLEIVAPLFCLALASTGFWLWERARGLGWAYAAGYAWFGAARAMRSLVARFVLER